MAGISINGIMSGLDIESIISQLMSIEKVPVSNKELKQKILTRKGEIYNDIKSRLENLENFARTLTYESTFNAFKASCSEESVISATASGGASNGVYALVVDSLARAHTIGSDRQADKSAALGLSGTMVINGQGVEVESGDSLEDIRDNINATEDTGVTASIIDNVLRLKMTETGATQITLTETGGVATALGILDSGTFKNEFVAASDALLTIDGQQMSSSSNVIDNLIEGVTVTLMEEGSVTLSISRDTGSIIENIQNFVNQYNSVADLIYSSVSERKIIPAESEADKLAGLVSGDATLQNMRFRLNMLMSDAVTGMDDDINQLSFIGINKTSFSDSSDNSDILVGKLTVDTAALTEALESDPEEVMELFNKNAGVEGLPDEEYGIAVRISNYSDSLANGVDGLITGRTAAFQKEIDMIEEQIESLNRRLELKEASLRKKYLLMETALSSMDTQSLWLESQLTYL
ncbi:MAG: flagellar filament capping protein FliD [Actinobacteria bacterium]|nr:flagellar filament capping protein FliD [Actinomycetota bacterium]